MRKSDFCDWNKMPIQMTFHQTIENSEKEKTRKGERERSHENKPSENKLKQSKLA